MPCEVIVQYDIAEVYYSHIEGECAKVTMRNDNKRKVNCLILHLHARCSPNIRPTLGRLLPNGGLAPSLVKMLAIWIRGAAKTVKGIAC